MGTFIADLVLQILSFVAQNVRDNIRKRQAQGIAAAQARGVHMGRPIKKIPEDFPQMIKTWEAGSMSLKETLLRCEFSSGPFYRRLREYQVASEKK